MSSIYVGMSSDTRAAALGTKPSPALEHQHWQHQHAQRAVTVETEACRVSTSLLA